MCTRRGAVGISGAPCRGRCPHRPAGGQSAPTGETPGVGVGAHCICARGAVAIPAGFPKTYCGTGGYLIRPYRVRCKLVGVDVLIDPTAQRPLAAPTARCTTGLGVGAHCIYARAGACEMMAATGGYLIRPYRVRCKLVGVDVLILGLVELCADLIHQGDLDLVVAPAAVDGERHLVAG